jgi:hypothetical protein
MDARSRDRMSPSPELDLSDYDSNASDPFSNQSHPPTTANIAHNRRAQSPPLEKDEREFTQTASFLQQRRRSQEAERERSASAAVEPKQSVDVVMHEVAQSVEETEESAARKNSEAAAALFGHMEHLSRFQASLSPSSPAVKSSLHLDMPPPSLKRKEVTPDLDDDDWTMRSPENIDMDELDDLFGNY